MRYSIPVVAAAFAASSLACSAQAPRPETVAHLACDSDPGLAATAKNHLEPGQVRSVAALHEKELVARAIERQRLVGAELRVAAESGVTREYLERALSCHAAKGEPSSDRDPVAIAPSVRVRVEGDDGSFRIRVTSKDAGVAQQIWQRAEEYQSPPRVEIEQVARNETQAQF